MQPTAYGWKRHRLKDCIGIQFSSIEEEEEEKQNTSISVSITRRCCGTEKKNMYVIRNLDTTKPQDALEDQLMMQSRKTSVLKVLFVKKLRYYIYANGLSNLLSTASKVSRCVFTLAGTSCSFMRVSNQPIMQQNSKERFFPPNIISNHACSVSVRP